MSNLVTSPPAQPNSNLPHQLARAEALARAKPSPEPSQMKAPRHSTRSNPAMTRAASMNEVSQPSMGSPFVMYRSLTGRTVSRPSTPPVPEPYSGSGQTFIVCRRVGGLSKSWKEIDMHIESNGTLSFSDGGYFSLPDSLVEVPWMFDAKTGQRFWMTIVDANNQAKEQIQMGSARELDECLHAFSTHGCSVHRPIKCGALVVDKKPIWCVLYADCFQCFKVKTDSKPFKVIQITEASLLDRGADDVFVLAESGDEHSNGISFLLAPSEEKEWLDVLEQAIANRADKKCQDSLLEGYIWKCGETGGFKRRFCVLRLENIRYYKKRFDEQAAGIIRLNPGAEAGPYHDNSTRKHQFWVSESGDEGIRKYLMAAQTEAEKCLWLQTLSEVFACKDNQVHSQSLIEGYLEKRSKKGRWKKYFFIVLKDMAMFRAKRNDFIFASETPKGVIDLNQAFELHALNPSSEHGLNRFGLFTLAANGDEEGTRTYILHAEDDEKRAQWLHTLTELRKTKNTNVNPRSVKEGYLTKRAAKRDKWSKRYFVLLEDRLLYYRKRQDAVERGDIKIEGAAEIAEVADDERDLDHRYRFSIVESGDDQGTRMYYISCPSAEVRTQWMSCITKIINSHDARVMPGSIVEGYLWKCPKNGGAWQKRYFILKPNQMIYLKKRLDKTEAGTTEIKGEAQISIVSDPEHPFAFCVSKSGDAGERRFLLQARDDATRFEWVSQLRQQASLFAVKEVADSMLEGYLFMATSSTSWRKTYFILERSPPTLSFLTKRKDLKPTLKFAIEKGFLAVLVDNKVPFHGSVWGRHEGDDTVTLNGLGREEKDMVDEDGTEEGADAKAGDGIHIIVAKNGDVGAKVTRLKGAGVSEALFVSCVIELCIRKEFPPPDTPKLKAGYVMVRLHAKSERWVSSYVELSSDRLMCFKSQDDELPVLIASLESAQLFSGVSGDRNSFGVTDKNGREVSMRAQSEEERLSWTQALSLCMTSLKNGTELRRITLFGADLKTSFPCSCFYDFPSVIGACVEFLKKSVNSGCLLRHPGFLPLIRSFIQDFELKLDVQLTDAPSVAACLKLYLLMLPNPIIPDTIAREIYAIVQETPNDAGNALKIAKVMSRLEHENSVALNVLLHYLSHEIDQPEVVEATLPKVCSVWGPLLIRCTNEAKNDENKSLILSSLIKCVRILYPAGPLILIRKLAPATLLHLKSDPNLTFELLRKDAYGMKLYARFVKENFIDENLQFSQAVEQYREMFRSSKFSAEKCFALGAKICKTYVSQGAEVQINVSAVISATILARFDPNVRRVLTGTEFSEAEVECDLLEATNSFPRFKKTEGFDEWVTHRYEMEQKSAVAQPRKTVLAPPPQVSSVRRGLPRHKVEDQDSLSPTSIVQISRADSDFSFSNDNSYRNSSVRFGSSYLRSSVSCSSSSESFPVRSSESCASSRRLMREELSNTEEFLNLNHRTAPARSFATSPRVQYDDQTQFSQSQVVEGQGMNVPSIHTMSSPPLRQLANETQDPRRVAHTQFDNAVPKQDVLAAKPLPPARRGSASFVIRRASLPNQAAQSPDDKLAASKPARPARSRPT